MKTSTKQSGTQEEVFAFLMGFTTDPPVSRIDTHAATVFLAGPRALKIKRAVRFPFLDYSTLAKRKAACEAENDGQSAHRAADLSPRGSDHPDR